MIELSDNNCTKILDEEGIVYINEDPYKVTQTSPTIEILKSAVEVATFSNEYGNLLTIIKKLQAKMDKVLSDDIEDIENTLKSYEDLNKLKKDKEKEIGLLFDKISNKINESLIFYLGDEVFEKELKSLGFIDKSTLVQQCSLQNKNMSLLIKKELMS
jgi:hypothetical protein